MSQVQEDNQLVEEVRSLAFGSAKDVVKLLFLNPEKKKLPKKLDLRMVSEIKRSGNGGIEIKLLNRIELFKLLAQLTVSEASSPVESGEAESFFSAMDKAAAKLKDAEI